MKILLNIFNTMVLFTLELLLNNQYFQIFKRYFEISISNYNPNNKPLMRVRKEIRSITADQWDRVVNAIWIMKSLSLIEGRLRYGRKFITYDLMILKHARASFDARGDQAHNHPVFPLYHRCWVLQFEQSIMSIDPKIESLPYWDETIDSTILSNFRYPQQHPSFIFSDKYMGAHVGEGPLYQVRNGRFANWPISFNISNEVDFPSNIYGFFRHPLSFNPSEVLTRNGGGICVSELE